MYTIVGLGNPGPEYARTRHNAGWIALTQVLRTHRFPDPAPERGIHGEVAVGVLFGCDARVVFPHTFMNRSGEVVAALVGQQRNKPLKDFVLVHDDIDLPFGVVRVSYGRGAGGHNGVQSVIDSLNTNAFVRVRIGIAYRTLWGTIKRPSGEALSRFVLSDFSAREMKALPAVGTRVARALELIMTEGIEKAMQEINGGP